MESADNKFIQLLRISVLRQYIFQYLPLKVMYGLRGVSSEIKLLIDEVYLPSELRVLHLTSVPIFTSWLTIFDDYDKNGFKMISTQARSLRVLSLPNCEWLTNDLLIDTLQSNPYLNKLNISGCTALSPYAFHSIIGHGNNIKILNIIDCNFQLLNLKEIELNEFQFEEVKLSAHFYQAPYLVKLVQRCKNLRALTLKFDVYKEPDPFTFDKIRRTKHHVLEALANCKVLKMLILKNGRYFTDAVLHFCSNLATCKNIQCLSLIKCIDLTCIGLKALRNFKNLKQLILDYHFSLTANHFRYLAVCENIQILILNNCNCVDDGVLEIISHIRNLKRLYLFSDFAFNYTSAGISCVVKKCPSLEEIFLSGESPHFPLPDDCFQLLKVVIHIIKYSSNSFDAIGSFPTWNCCKTHGRQSNIITKID